MAKATDPRLRNLKHVGPTIERTASVAIVHRRGPFSPWEFAGKGFTSMDWDLALEFAYGLGGHGTDVGLVNANSEIWIISSAECERNERGAAKKLWNW